MKNGSIHNENDTFLAQWFAEEISDDTFKQKVSEEDFLWYQKLKKELAVFESESTINANYDALKATIENRKKTKIRRLYLKWGASVAAVLLLFLAVQNFFITNTIENATSFGEQKTIALLDGSKVILKAKSKITYNKKDWENNRALYLDGEAFFKVKKGNTFTVNTKNGSVEVLGTQFNVNTKSDFLEVVCYSGKVKVTNQDKTFILTPSNGLREINGTVERIITPLITPTWIAGKKSTYQKVPLKYVISDMEKQFNVTFDQTQIDGNRLFTGGFDHKNKQVAFATVFKAMLINYKVNKDNVVVLSQ